MLGCEAMAFIDEVKITAQAGNGGIGVVRWLRQKETAKGGPSGGDGGRGGDVILEGVRDLAVLSNYRYTKKFRAEHGEGGSANNKHGKDGAPAVLKVPVGTVAYISSTKETVEIMHEGERIVVLRGGPGGYGNAHFKGSTNQNPFESTPGKPGQGGDIELTLKLIADAGLIGFPNAGKSSLLNTLTRAKSKVGAYPFTTLDPHLGDFYGHLLADIPGLIEGASDGRGLGSKFLRHIERTGLLIHLISAEQDDSVGAYQSIRAELAAFGRGLAEKPELVVLSKTDLLEPEKISDRVAALEAVVGKGKVATVSIADDEALKAFSDRLSGLLVS
jgi:GTPase